MNDLFKSIYELLYYQEASNFSADLDTFQLYGIIGIMTIIFALASMATFYYLINSPRFNKTGHWLIFLLINFLLIFLFTYFYPKGIFEKEGIETSNQLFVIFALVNGLLGTVYYFLFSMFFKRWSANCSVTPMKANIP